MDNKSLIDKLEDLSGRLSASNNRPEKDLGEYLSEENKAKCICISISGAKLVYDDGQFEDDPSDYVKEQLKSHHEHYEQAKVQLNLKYKELDKIVDDKNDMERILDAYTPFEEAIHVSLTKLLMAPSVWLKFKTLKGYFKEIVMASQKEVEQYGQAEEIIRYGNRFISEKLENINQPESLKKDLASWKNIHDELVFVYSMFSNTAKNILAAHIQYYNRIYPNSKDF